MNLNVERSYCMQNSHFSCVVWYTQHCTRESNSRSGFFLLMWNIIVMKRLLCHSYPVLQLLSGADQFHRAVLEIMPGSSGCSALIGTGKDLFIWTESHNSQAPTLWDQTIWALGVAQAVSSCVLWITLWALAMGWGNPLFQGLSREQNYHMHRTHVEYSLVSREQSVNLY